MLLKSLCFVLSHPKDNSFSILPAICAFYTPKKADLLQCLFEKILVVSSEHFSGPIRHKVCDQNFVYFFDVCQTIQLPCYLLFLYFSMSRSGPRIPPLTCRICQPHIGFFRYSVFRAHIRASHQIKSISNACMRQFESYPNALADVIRDTPRDTPHTTGPENRAPETAPVTPPTSPTNSVPSHNVAPVSGDHAIASTSGGTAGGATQRVNQDETNQSSKSAHESNPDEPKTSTAVAVLPPVTNQVVFSVEQVQSLIQFEMDRVLKRRLPSLGTEIRLRVDAAVSQAISEDVPQMVGDILMRAADAYADGKRPDTERRSIGQNRTVERSGRNYKVTLNDSIEAAPTYTEMTNAERVTENIAPQVCDQVHNQIKPVGKLV